MKICAKCDLTFADDKKFCQKCGAPLTIIHKNEEIEIVNENVSEEQAKTVSVKVESSNEKPKKNKKNNRIVLSVLSGLIIIAVTIFLYPGNQNDLKKEGLHGKVKSINQSSYKPRNVSGNWEGIGDAFYTRKMAFDKNGNCTEIQIMDQRIIPRYENGVKVEEIRLEANGDLYSTSKFRLISENEIEYDFYIDGKKASTFHQYFKKGRLSKEIGTDLYGVTIRESEYTYDDDNNLTEERNKGKGLEFMQYFKNKYIKFDNKKNWTEILVFISKDEEMPSALLKRQIEYY